MQKRLIFGFVLIAYIAILIKVMVFKDLPLIRVGQLMLNFGGIDASHPANFIPFKTIVPYLLGYKGWIIAGINLVGNVALLIPVGVLAPLVYEKMTWKKSLVLAFVAGLIIEVLQVILRVGIFDIDDVILNAFGVMIGYWMLRIVARWLRERKYLHILALVIAIIAAAAGAVYAIYPHGQPVNPRNGDVGRAGTLTRESDLCGGTGGNGQITSLSDSSFIMEKREGGRQVVYFADQVAVETAAGTASESALKIGDRITLVGGLNPDGSFAADVIFVCSGTL